MDQTSNVQQGDTHIQYVDGREEIENLILQNKTMDALIKGLTADIEIFKNNKEGKWTPADIVRFTIQLNVMRDKKSRNLAAINEIIKRNSTTLQ
jgi:hypothetical protein